MSGGSLINQRSRLFSAHSSHWLQASREREGSERGEPAAVGLVKFVKTYYFVACCKLLSKVLPHINRLSLLFQREDIDLSAIRPNLNATIHAIETLILELLRMHELSAFDILFLMQWKMNLRKEFRRSMWTM